MIRVSSSFSTFSFSFLSIQFILDPRVLFGDVNLNAGTCGEGSPGCRCSWVKPEIKSCSYHIEGMGLISRVHAAGKEVSSDSCLLTNVSSSQQRVFDSLIFLLVVSDMAFNRWLDSFRCISCDGEESSI